MTATPFNWKPLAGRALEASLNRAIALDPETRDALRPLAGQRVVLQLENPPLALQLTVAGERLEVGPVATQEPELSVRSSLGALLAQLPRLLARDAQREDAPPVGKLRIAGDADLARRLQRLAERFDPDWQQPFVAVFGEVLGVQIGNAVAAALRQARTAGAGLAASAAEYVTEESRDVVAKAELHAFHDDVDMLRDDAERLAARIARLQRTAPAPAPDGGTGERA